MGQRMSEVEVYDTGRRQPPRPISLLITLGLGTGNWHRLPPSKTTRIKEIMSTTAVTLANKQAVAITYLLRC